MLVQLVDKPRIFPYRSKAGDRLRDAIEVGTKPDVVSPPSAHIWSRWRSTSAIIASFFFAVKKLRNEINADHAVFFDQRFDLLVG